MLRNIFLIYPRSGINQMWILKNSKELLEHHKSQTFNHVSSIKSFEFSTLYKTIHCQKLKDTLTNIIRNAFIFKTVDTRRYKYLVFVHEETFLWRSTLILKTCTLKLTSSRCLSFLLTIFSWFLPEKSPIVPLLSSISFCIYMKRISYSLSSQQERNTKHLGSISLTGTSMMYRP